MTILSSSGHVLVQYYSSCAVYVDDILLTRNDTTGIVETKEYLRKYFITKDMERPRFFLEIEFAYGQNKIVLSQRKYVIDLLQETELLGCKL